jgi:hypothetical protein
LKVSARIASALCSLRHAPIAVRVIIPVSVGYEQSAILDLAEAFSAAQSALSSTSGKSVGVCGTEILSDERWRNLIA